LTFHWYEGIKPPFTGVAVKITRFPSQGKLVEGEIVILTGKFGLTVMVIVLLVAGFPDGQIILDVRIHLTISPLFGE
jgi:hypothetical protein